MKVFYTDHFVLPLPKGHRFPMRKYALLRQRVASSGIVAPEQLIVPHAATDTELLRAHDAEYLRRCQRGELTPQEIRRIGFPWSPEMVERSRRSSGATIEACRAALEDGVRRQPGRRHAPRLPRSRRGLLRVQRQRGGRARDAGRGPRPPRRDHRLRCTPGQRHRRDPGRRRRRSSPSRSTARRTSRSTRSTATSISRSTTAPATRPTSRRSTTACARRSSSRTPTWRSTWPAPTPTPTTSSGGWRSASAAWPSATAWSSEYCRDAGIPVAVTMAGGYARDVEDTVDIHFQTVRAAAEQ